MQYKITSKWVNMMKRMRINLMIFLLSAMAVCCNKITAPSDEDSNGTEIPDIPSSEKPGEVPPTDGVSEDFSGLMRVGIFGDSISTFGGELSNPDYWEWYPLNDTNVDVDGKEHLAVDSREKTWWWRLIYEHMKAGVLDANNSWSGTKIIHETVNGKGGLPRDSGFVDRINDFNSPDVIIVFGGTNDSLKDTPVGDYQWDVPMEDMNLAQFRSAYVYLVRKLQATYDGVQLILVIGDSLTPEYETSIMEIAEHFSLPYVNLVGENVSKIDSVHPDAEGHELLARKIYNLSRSYLE